MNHGDLCICTHTREIHFGRECSKVGCRCRRFVVLDLAVELFEALNNAVPFLRRFAEQTEEHLRTSQTPVHQMSNYLEQLVAKAETS
jgi:hypothetical protein